MDLNRVGIYGSSAGGADAVAALIWHSDLYKVGVADCGNHDLSRDNLYWAEQWMGWPVGPAYRENSNLTYASALNGLLLIMVGDKDDRVEPQNSLDLAAALQGKGCKLVTVPGGGHVVQTLTRPGVAIPLVVSIAALILLAAIPPSRARRGETAMADAADPAAARSDAAGDHAGVDAADHGAGTCADGRERVA